MTDASRTDHTQNILSRHQLSITVDLFVNDTGLTDQLPLLRKAAILAQGDIAASDVPGITEFELEALSDETAKRFRQTKQLWITTLVCSIGAIVQGWSQTGSNGATLTFPTAFGIGSDSAQHTLIVGLINAAPYMCVALLGAWIARPVNAKLGRRGAILLASIFSLVASLASASAQTWQQLAAARIILGLGMGLGLTTVPVFAAESAPSAIRGGLAVSWQMFTAGGIFLGFCANLAVFKVGLRDWPRP